MSKYVFCKSKSHTRQLDRKAHKCKRCGTLYAETTHPYSNKYCSKCGVEEEHAFRETQNQWAEQDAREDASGYSEHLNSSCKHHEQKLKEAYKKESKEHPWASKQEIEKIVADHDKLGEYGKCKCGKDHKNFWEGKTNPLGRPYAHQLDNSIPTWEELAKNETDPVAKAIKLKFAKQEKEGYSSEFMTRMKQEVKENEDLSLMYFRRAAASNDKLQKSNDIGLAKMYKGFAEARLNDFDIPHSKQLDETKMRDYNDTSKESIDLPYHEALRKIFNKHGKEGVIKQYKHDNPKASDAEIRSEVEKLYKIAYHRQLGFEKEKIINELKKSDEDYDRELKTLENTTGNETEANRDLLWLIDEEGYIPANEIKTKSDVRKNLHQLDAIEYGVGDDYLFVKETFDKRRKILNQLEREFTADERWNRGHPR